MEILKHRLEEESRARATADSRILEVRLAGEYRRISGCRLSPEIPLICLRSQAKARYVWCVKEEVALSSGWGARLESRGHGIESRSGH